MDINEIAFELGFTDESHMNKLFRKYRNLSSSEFRQENKVEHLGLYLQNNRYLCVRSSCDYVDKEKYRDIASWDTKWD